MAERNHLFSTRLNSSFNKAIKGVKKALREAGFEVISELNFSDFIKDCLGIRLDKKYIILEVCHPFIAYN